MNSPGFNTKAGLPTDVSIITTYRCQMRCVMCDIWENPTDKKLEITPRDLEILPHLKFANITGGEPFVRRDLEDIVSVVKTRAQRVVISTSGWHTDRILALARKHPDVGIRVSIEGLAETNDQLRGRAGTFDRALRLLLSLREMGLKDIGYGCTVSDKNSGDMLWLYKLSRELGMEFATAAFHNSYYFHKSDNKITDPTVVTENFGRLIELLLKENSPKAWFRAFFNLGLINYVKGGKRMLPCEAGSANFFIEPYGDVFPCNGLEERYWKRSMGNIRDFGSFDELWFGREADAVRALVRTCPKNCWMVGTAAPVMKKYLRHPAAWVLRNKLRSMAGLKVDVSAVPYFDVGQDPRQGDLRGGETEYAPIEIVRSRPGKVELSEDELSEMLRVD